MMAGPNTEIPAVLFLHDEYGASECWFCPIPQQVAETFKEHVPNIPLICTVLQATEKEKQDADRDGVELLLPKLDPNDPRTVPSLSWLTFDHQTKYPHLPSKVRSIVGFTDVTSRAAVTIKEAQYPETRVILFTSDIPEDTEYYKGDEKAMGIGKKEDSILKDAQEAKVVFSLGNKIYDHFENQFRAIPANKRPQHFKFVPRPSKPFREAKYEFKMSGTMVVLSFGEVNGVEKLQGHDIAAEALSIVAEKMKVRCRVIGVKKDDFKTSKAILEHSKSPNLQITLLPYGTKEDIHKNMMQAHLVLMPSRAEPFGLVGLEAIAAGVPVLVSSKSGLADFVLGHVDEFHHSVVDMDESEEGATAKRWADAIEKVLKHYKSSFETAARCRQKLLSTKYWEESHHQFIKACTGAGNSTQQPAEVKKRKRMATPAGESDEEVPPPLPIVVEILAQVIPNVKTPEQLLSYASAKMTLVTLDITTMTEEILCLLEQVKPEIKTIQDLLNTTAAIKELEKVRGVNVISVKAGSLVFYLQCSDLGGLGKLWFMYKNGELDNLLHGSLISEETSEQLSAESITVKATIKVQDFRKVWVHLQTTAAAKGRSIPRLPLEYPPYQPHSRTTSNVLEVLHLDDSNLPSPPGVQHDQDIPVPEQAEDSSDVLATNLWKLQIDETAEESPEQRAALQPIDDLPTTAQSTTDSQTIQSSTTVLSRTDELSTAKQQTEAATMVSEESDLQLPLKNNPRNNLYRKIDRHLSKNQISKLQHLVVDHRIALSMSRMSSCLDPDVRPYDIFKMLEDDDLIGEGDLGLLKALLTKLGEKQLVEEAVNVEKEELQNLLLSEDINMADKDGRTPLWRAARNDNFSTVELLLSMGADVNIADKDGRTPLCTAAACNCLSTVEMLLRNGADVNMADNDGRTPLWRAVRNDNLSAVEMLLRNGADVNIADKDGRTPLWTAAECNCLSTVEMLLRIGADVNMTDKDVRTPLSIAAENRHLSAVELLLTKGADVNMTDKDGQTPLWTAAQKGNLPTVEMLLSMGADVNIADNDGRTPLWTTTQHWSQISEHYNTIKMLLGKGADVNMADKTNLTPLLIAAQKGLYPVVQMLVSNDADVNIQDSVGHTPLKAALDQSHFATADFLLNFMDIRLEDVLLQASYQNLPSLTDMVISKGADVNLPDKDGQSPLWAAAQGGIVSKVELLLSKGADVNMAGKDGRTPLWIAVQNCHLPIVEMLFSKGADVNMADKDGQTPLWIAAHWGQLNTIKTLFSKGADVNMADNEGRTPLWTAAQTGHHSTAKLLLDKEADFNTTDKDGRTPLWIAAEKGHHSTAKLLLNKGANVNMADNCGRTPLWTAAENGHLSTVELLLSKGADVNMTDKDGISPANVARSMGHSDVEEMIIKHDV